MDKQITQVMMDKVSKKLHKREFLSQCHKHEICPECGEPVKEQMMCHAIFDQAPSLHGTGAFNCDSCGNNFRYQEYK